MNILIFNCGSSSQGFKVYEVQPGKKPNVLVSGKALNVATRTRASSSIRWDFRGNTGTREISLPSHTAAAAEIIRLLQSTGLTLDAVGHRFVHGGTRFQKTTRIDENSLRGLKECFSLAPIHNPNSYAVIEICRELLPDAGQYAVFDTAFHAGMPAASREYALPRSLALQNGFRKYGFHGLSYQYISARTAEYLGRPLSDLKLILCHLGTGGSSITAVKDGHSLDSSMGYSPLAGLVMSTRCGDLDAGIILDLIRGGRSADEVESILNTQSGLIGLSGFSSNLEEVIEESEKGNADCRLAFEVYAHRLRLYLGAFHWLLNSTDAIVFTDDVGVRCWRLRAAVCGDVKNLGIELDAAANRAARPGKATCISAASSRTKILVMPTDEERIILEEVLCEMNLTD
ncbi:MAG: acetate/propionate family kinase [Leptolinea sp.]|jgi:acetate kinase|nr:acetate/propionate family kinase [Leptolinea sp.]